MTRPQPVEVITRDHLGRVVRYFSLDYASPADRQMIASLAALAIREGGSITTTAMLEQKQEAQA